jgi:hypothetical protein
MSLHTCECLIISYNDDVTFCGRPAFEKKETETRGWIWICDICEKLPYSVFGLGTSKLGEE